MTVFFPNTGTIINYLSSDVTFNNAFYKKKLLSVIVILAAERFADRSCEKANVDLVIKAKVQGIFFDLEQGENSYSGVKITKVKLSPALRDILMLDLRTSLRACVKSN